MPDDVKSAIASFAQTSPALAVLRGEQPKEPAKAEEQVLEGSQQPSTEAEESVEDVSTLEEGQADVEESENEVAEPLVTLTVQGQVKKVPLSEVVAKAQQADDYTQKSMKLAEERKSVESKAAEISTLQKTYAERLSMLEAALKPQVPTPDMLNQALQSGDTARYLQMQNQLIQYNSVIAERKAVEAQQAQQQEAQLKQRLAEEQQALTSKLPEYAKPEAHTKLRSFLLNNGMSEAEVNTLSDHRAVIIADKAMKYDELMAKRPELQKRVEGLPRLTQKVTAPSQQTVNRAGKMQAIETLEKTGRFANADQRMKVLGAFLK